MFNWLNHPQFNSWSRIVRLLCMWSSANFSQMLDELSTIAQSQLSKQLKRSHCQTIHRSLTRIKCKWPFKSITVKLNPSCSSSLSSEYAIKCQTYRSRLLIWTTWNHSAILGSHYFRNAKCHSNALQIVFTNHNGSLDRDNLYYRCRAMLVQNFGNQII